MGGEVSGRMGGGEVDEWVEKWPSGLVGEEVDARVGGQVGRWVVKIMKATAESFLFFSLSFCLFHPPLSFL